MMSKKSISRARDSDDSEHVVSMIAVKIRFTPLQLQGLRRVVNPKKKGDPEVFTIKAENLGKGDVINIRADEEEKVQRAIDNGTGVKITFDGNIQTKPILEWIHSTLHTSSSKKQTTSSLSKKKKKSPVKKLLEAVDKLAEQEGTGGYLPTQLGKGGYLPTQPRGRGFMLNRGLMLNRRMHVAPSLQQFRARQARTAQTTGTGLLSRYHTNKSLQRKIHNLLAPKGKK